MGRKTNSVSLRLKKTNRDYNNCWYGDILYAENFSKSLKVENYLSQTLKTIGMPWPQASVIGAFKKASLLVCYLDPKKRKRLLEKSSKGYAPARPVELVVGSKEKTNLLDHAYQSKQSKTTGFSFFSLDQIKQNSKALLKPLEAILETRFSGPSSLQHPSKHYYVGTPPFAEGGMIPWIKHCKKGKVMDKTRRVTDKTDFIVKNMEVCVNKELSKKTTKHLSYMYRGSLGLEFNQSLGSYARVYDFLSLQKKEKKGFSGRFMLVPLEHYKGLNYKGLDNTSFAQKKTLSKNSISSNEPTFFSCEGESQQSSFLTEKKRYGTLSEAKTCLQFFPYIFENNVINQKEKKEKKKKDFFVFSDFFWSNKNQTQLICAFNKNLTIFGKNMDLSVSNTSFPCLSDYVYNTSSCTKDYIKNILDKKKQLCKRKETGSRDQKTSLYGFYNGFSRFWENVVSLSLYKSTNETSCALFLADTVSYLLERKILFRSIKRQLLLELNQSKSLLSFPEFPKLWGVPSARAFENKKKVIGIRISCSGRVGGRSKKAQRSRKDTFMWGETGLHVFSSKLDFYKTHAETPFGVVGVQVWVCTK